MNYLISLLSWTEKPIATLDDVANTFGQIEGALETVACECVTIWKTDEDPTKKVTAIVARLNSCQKFLENTRRKITDQKHAEPWKKLAELEGKLLVLQKQAAVCTTTVQDPQYKRFVELFQKSINALKAQKGKTPGERIKDFKASFNEVETAVKLGENVHAKAILREGVLFLQAMHEHVDNASLEESRVLDDTKARFTKLLQAEDEEEWGEPVFTERMQQTSLEEHSTLTKLFDERSRTLSLKRGRSFAGWNPLAARHNPHIIASVRILEQVFTKLQAVEALLEEQLPKICRSELSTTQEESNFYEKKINSIDDEISSAKKQLYTGAYPSEMKVGLTYVSRVEVVARHVRFAVQFFSDLTNHFMPLATAQKRLLKVLYPEGLQLLDDDNPLATYIRVQNLYRFYLAYQKLPDFADEFKRGIKRSITEVFNLLASRRGERTADETNLYDLIIDTTKSIETVPPLLLKSLLGKLSVEYLAFAKEQEKKDHQLLTVKSALMGSEKNRQLLLKIREEDTEFSQILDSVNWTR